MHLKNHILYSVIGLTFVCGFAFSSAVYADESTVDTIDITVPSSCTFGNGGGGTYNATMNNSDTEVITANSITITCNDSSGYAVYAIGFSGDSYYGNNTDLISTLGSNYNIKTDGTGTYGSSWKMKITAVTNATAEGNYGTFQNIPATYAKVASFNTNTTSGTITPSYQINISSTQPADTFEGKVKYTLVHPASAVAPMLPLRDTDCPANSICYAPNASDIVGSMSTLGTTTDLANATSSKGGKVSATSNTEATLIAPNYSRPGYGFAGWSADFEADNSSTIYGPNETITVPDVSSHGLILYPVWIASTGNLQGWMGCSSLTTAPTNTRATLASMIALKDTRDNNVYAVARLADGKCWMVENLRLNAEDSRGDTNIAKAQGYGDATANNQGKFIGLADSEDNFPATNGINDSTDANSVYYAGTQSGTATVNIFKTNYASYRMPRYNNNNTNMANDATNSSGLPLTDSYDTNNDQVRWFGYGNYYSWSAAIADTAYYNLNNYHVGNTSICPNGWHLPEGGDKDNSANSEFWALAVASIGAVPVNTSSQTRPYYTGSKEGANATKILRAFPNNFVYSGRFDNSSTTHFRSSTGFYWSSSAYGSYSEAYNLVLTDSHVYPGDNVHDRQFGRSVRCVIQPLPNTI